MQLCWFWLWKTRREDMLKVQFCRWKLWLHFIHVDSIVSIVTAKPSTGRSGLWSLPSICSVSESSQVQECLISYFPLRDKKLARKLVFFQSVVLKSILMSFPAKIFLFQTRTLNADPHVVTVILPDRGQQKSWLLTSEAPAEGRYTYVL